MKSINSPISILYLAHKLPTQVFLTFINLKEIISKHSRMKMNRHSNKRAVMKIKRTRMKTKKWSKKIKIMRKKLKMKRMEKTKNRLRMTKRRTSKRKRARQK